MISPVLQNIVAFIRLNRKDNTPLYLQIAQGITNAILSNVMQQGMKLPGSRQLAARLYVHRKTIIAAYTELEAQSWIEIIPKKGAFVSRTKIKLTKQPAPSLNEQNQPLPFLLYKNQTLDLSQPQTNVNLYLTEGTADYRMYNLRQLNSQFNAQSQRKLQIKSINRNIHQETFALKYQLINFICVDKGLRLQLEELLITSQYKIALHTVFRTLLSTDDAVVILQPNYYFANMLFQDMGIRTMPIQVESKVDWLDELEKKLVSKRIRAIYLSTKQLLLRSSPPISEYQKNRLLDLAKEHKFIILEDDCGSDFIFNRNYTSSLKHMDKFGSVVYINSLEHLLLPPYDIGYIIAAPEVIAEMNKRRNTIQHTSNPLIESALADYIKEGLLWNHLQKSTKIYQRRRDHLHELLGRQLENSIHYHIPQGGLAYWITLNQHIALLELLDSSHKKGLHIPAHLVYQDKSTTAIQWGFGHMTESESEQALQIFAEALYKR